MLKIGSTDAFERRYMGRFRSLASDYGEFVFYERDRGARDIGLHLTRMRASGGEVLAGPLCWFQMKGLMAASLSIEDFKRSPVVKVPLSVAHLRYWLLQPVPTYLALYVESADQFLILNLTRYVEERWGTSILTLAQGEATVEVPRGSLLDDQAFDLIMAESDRAQWAKALGSDEETAGACRKDYNLIWRLGTATERGVEHRVVFWDYQSKTRSQFWFQERNSAPGAEWVDVREHWQFMMEALELQHAYPYVEFCRLDDVIGPTASEAAFIQRGRPWLAGERLLGDPPPVVVANGDVVEGFNFVDEYFRYHFGARLNALGRDLFDSVDFLREIGLLEIDTTRKETLSVAPWHGRSV